MTREAGRNDMGLARFRRLADYRHFDEACLEGVATREIHGELHLGMGQEAISAGMAEHLRAGDAMTSTHRNHHHALAHGVDPKALMAEIFERETGLCGGFGGHMHPFDAPRLFSATGIVGAALPVAAGHAYAFAMRAARDGAPEDGLRIAVAATGDGAVSTGGFHETMIMAGAWRLPLVVVIENNDLAISVRTRDISPTETLAERAAGYAAWGRRVDGTDPDVVADAFAEAAAHARQGRGPAILEATCHRFRGHFEGDHDTYRDRKERARQRREADPLVLYRAKLEAEGVSATDLDAILAESKEAARAMLASVRADPMPDPDRVPPALLGRTGAAA